MKTKKPNITPLTERALLSTPELAQYLGLGVAKATELGCKANARMKVGRRTLFRRAVIDKYLASN